jgi:hypothetical protein
MAYMPKHLKPDQKFPPRAVQRALLIPSGTLSTWARNGWMTNFDVAMRQGRGKAKLFSVSDVLALALIKFCSDRGITQTSVICNAPEVADAYLQHGPQITEVTFLWYRDMESVRFNDEVMKDPADPGALLRITINVQEIFDAALRAIDQEVPADVEREARLEEIDPSLPDIRRGWFYPADGSE